MLSAIRATSQLPEAALARDTAHKAAALSPSNIRLRDTRFISVYNGRSYILVAGKNSIPQKKYFSAANLTQPAGFVGFKNVDFKDMHFCLINQIFTDLHI